MRPFDKATCLFSFHHLGEDNVLVPLCWFRIISLEMCSLASCLIDFAQATFRQCVVQCVFVDAYYNYEESITLEIN